MRHLLAIGDLERSDIERIMERAEGFAPGPDQVIGLHATRNLGAGDQSST